MSRSSATNARAHENADVRSASLATRPRSPKSVAKRVVPIGLVTLALLAIASPFAVAQDTRASSRRPDPIFAEPRLVPGPGTVVFFSHRDPAGSFYAESGAGGPLRLLLAGTNREGDITGALFFEGVAWAPSGKHFLYLVTAPPGQTEDQLWSSDLTGNERRLVARGASWPPSWSPDGRKIAFPVEGYGIWMADASGQRAHPLTAGNSDDKPIWSPDGRLIAYLSSESPSPCGFDLMAVAPRGGAPHRLAQHVASGPSWSPHGKQIAFEGFTACTSTPGSSYPTGLYVADRRGRHARLIDRCADGAPAWSPDGKWIAVARGSCVTSAATSGTWIEHQNGGGRRLLSTMVPYTVDVDNPVAPVWAPDSRQLAVAAIAEGAGNTDIWVLNVNGDARQLTEGSRYGYNNYGPSWQPRNLPPERLGGSVVSPALPTDTIVVNGVLQATRPVQAIAADGARVAIQYAAAQPADAYRSIETWDAQSGSIVRFEGGGGDYQGPAIAGDRLAYAGFEFGSYFLWTATLGRPAAEFPGLCPSQPLCDDPLGDVAGKGSLLVFDSWKRPQSSCDQPCSGPKRDSRLFRIDNETAVQIASSSGELTPLAVDNGRILVDHGSGTLAILDANGAELVEVAAPGFTEPRLQGSDLVARAGGTLDDYDAASGVLMHAWPVPADAKLQDVQDGLAVYATSSDIHLLRLVDGHDSTIRPPGTGLLHAQLEPAGLFYSYSVLDSDRPGRVAFVPSANLP
jgi:Tol biopolymer transport system component